MSDIDRLDLCDEICTIVRRIKGVTNIVMSFTERQTLVGKNECEVIACMLADIAKDVNSLQDYVLEVNKSEH